MNNKFKSPLAQANIDIQRVNIFLINDKKIYRLENHIEN